MARAPFSKSKKKVITEHCISNFHEIRKHEISFNVINNKNKFISFQYVNPFFFKIFVYGKPS